MKKITIIVPFYNDSKNIKKLLDSINQINELADVLLIDDKSDTEERKQLNNICLHYSNVRIMTNESIKKGAGVCRNIGLYNTNTEWVMFADSDDHFLNDLSRILYPYFNSNYEMVYFEPVSYDEKGIEGTRHLTYVEYHKDIEDLRYKLPVVWSRLFKNEFLKKNNFLFDTTLVSNDRLFSLKTGVAAKKIAVDHNKIYSWDYNSHSITTKMPEDKFLINLSVFIRTNKYLKNNVSDVKFKKYSESGLKMIVSSLVRYRYGVKFTLGVFRILLKNNVKIISPRDLKRVRTFFKNNKYYKSN